MDTNTLFDLLESAAGAFALARLIQLGLRKPFRALVAWLAFQSGSNLIYSLMGHKSGAYYWTWLAFTAIECIVGIIAVGGLFSLVFENYPGIRSVGTRAMYAGVLLATAASFLLTALFRRQNDHGDTLLFHFEVAQRSVVFSLAIVIATILFCLSRYPLHLGRNTYVVSGLFSVIFLSQAAQLLFDSLAPYLFNHVIDRSVEALIFACLIAWAVLLQPAPARKPERVIFSTPAEDHLLAQLTALNQMIGRTVRQ
jgi:hypothetical protein